jgi:CubicO group peptidase (beta-lactamase class C family)
VTSVFDNILRARRFIGGESFVRWFAIFATCGSLAAQADEVDDVIAARMQERHLNGLSLAIVQDGKIIKAKGYGFTDKSAQTPVTAATLFQAGSISKTVAAFGALHLVQEGRLLLDADVNAELRTWKVPENEFTRDKKVTLRGILSHSAGLTVHGFPGYPADGPIPALVEVLDGVKPANTPAIRVDMVPGSKWRYSGGGYAVMQQMMIDATRQPFPEFMSDTVLKPLGMTNSTYDQPVPPKLAALTAAGYFVDGHGIRGLWHIYPEMAAAGLWTTPSDLARFTIGVQQALAGESNPVLSQEMTRQMLTVQNPSLSDSDGLGVFVGGSGKALRFWHDGRNAGFDAFMLSFAHFRRGVVIMINANDDTGAIKDIVDAIAKEYWEAPGAQSAN